MSLQKNSKILVTDIEEIKNSVIYADNIYVKQTYENEKPFLPAGGTWKGTFCIRNPDNKDVYSYFVFVGAGGTMVGNIAIPEGYQGFLFAVKVN